MEGMEEMGGMGGLRIENKMAKDLGAVGEDNLLRTRISSSRKSKKQASHSIRFVLNQSSPRTKK